MSITGRLMVQQFRSAVVEGRVLMVSRLSVRTSPAVLKSVFENYGPVNQVHRNIDVKDGVYTGPGYVQLENSELVNNIMIQRDIHIDGKEVVINPCKYVPPELANRERKPQNQDR